MTTTETTTPFFLDQTVLEAIGPKVAEYFEQQFNALYDDAQRNNAFVGLRMFKRDYLERILRNDGARFLANVLVSQMIKEGKFRIELVANPFDSEHDTSAIRRV